MPCYILLVLINHSRQNTLREASILTMPCDLLNASALGDPRLGTSATTKVQCFSRPPKRNSLEVFQTNNTSKEASEIIHL